MNVVQFLSAMAGQWQGDYKLWLDPSKDPALSDTTLVVKPTANHSYFLIHYNWMFQGQDKAGVFLLGGKDQQVQASWGDSFHMEPLPMICQGELDGDKLVMLGSYPAGAEEWRWRTEFSLHAGKLVMRAYNISPSGQEDIAVEAVYQPHG